MVLTAFTDFVCWTIIPWEIIRSCVKQCCDLLLCSSPETTPGDQSTASNSGHSSSSSSSQSLNSAPGALGSTPCTMSSSSSSSSSSGQVPQSVQSPSPALLQDPALLHQLLPALQATLQMNNGSMDMAKLNEGEGMRRWFFQFRTYRCLPSCHFHLCHWGCAFSYK